MKPGEDNLFAVAYGVKGKVAYLSGAITSDPEFKEKFDEWECRLLVMGAKRVLSPAWMPPGWAYEEYMEHCMIMVRRAEVIVMLPCSDQSPGARAERAYAESLRRSVIVIGNQIPMVAPLPTGEELFAMEHDVYLHPEIIKDFL